MQEDFVEKVNGKTNDVIQKIKNAFHNAEKSPSFRFLVECAERKKRSDSFKDDINGKKHKRRDFILPKFHISV